ncbi:MAG: hypothetical protein WC979_10175 [Candidatus Pacearchaeota archaeon]|jgi:hypothetical protein
MFEKKRGNKRGQVTIFIIVGIIIVVAAVLIYTFYPKIKTTLGIEESNPQNYIQSCVEDKLKETIELVSLQGGSVNPENYIIEGGRVEYLCYVNEYFIPCLIQQPLLKQHIESEILNEIEDTVDDCFDSLKESYFQKGYDVEIKNGDKDVELLPGKIISTFNNEVRFTKGEEVQEYEKFVIITNSNLYELVAIANSIIEWEATYGDADPLTYMLYYPNLKVETISRESGKRVYILTNRVDGNVFRFAVKSQVWPAGYATSTIIV